MIDYHCHLLPGLDDGSTSIDESLAMAQGLSEAGYTTVCCTPHCMKGYYEHSAQQVREAILMLQADLDNAGVELDLWPGMEYCLDECFFDFADDLLPLGDTRLLLCEAPQHAVPGIIREGLELIIDKGFIPLVAHPERSKYFYRMLTARNAERGTRDAEIKIKETPHSLGGLWKKIFASRVLRPASRDLKVSASLVPRPALPEVCLFQANLGSFVGFYPNGTRQRAYELLKAGLYACIASDLHNNHMADKILKPSIEKFDTNPLLKELADRTPADLEKLAEAGIPEEEVKEQGEFDF